ncbi:formylmethanofuran dehydrogenase subunit A [Candidatus Thorarchaeota archaeon]|nr:MAG: formylmethanofuran dehydrogenase subunit A [Candidatus Thorarchaeota archaeon]
MTSDNELLLRRCYVVDPANGIDGEIMDLSVSGGRIVESASNKAETIDIGERLVLPGGVDMHSHILGSKLSMARLLAPELHRQEPVSCVDYPRSGSGHVLPSSYIVGYRYSEMGYTTVVEPAVLPLKALSCWEELADVTNLHMGMLPLFCNSTVTFQYVQQEDLEGLAGYISWILENTGGWGVKLVNPGGVYAWAHRSNVHGLDDEIPDWSITPRDIILGVAETVEAMGLPHVTHLHPNNLGTVGNLETTLETLDALKKTAAQSERERVVHLTHVSFEAMSSVADESKSWDEIASGGLQLADYANKNKHFTADLGQITFGEAMTMTGDGPFQQSLYELTGNKWVNLAVDAEMPGGGGVVPYYYSEKSMVNSVQWAIGLEYALSVDDVSRCVITTDSPNAGPFTRYPLVFSWLMSQKQREEWLDRVHPEVRKRSVLESIEREWSLFDLATSTRAAPARILGIHEKRGHLGVGADADISVYDIRPGQTDLAANPEMIVEGFRTAHMTVLDGVPVLKSKFLATTHGHVFTVAPTVTESLRNRMERELEDSFKRWYSHSFANYPVPSRYRSPFEQKTRVDCLDISL